MGKSKLIKKPEKGRQQQIIALQARIKELERIKLQSQENPSQIKQVKKDYQDFIEKYKKEIKQKDAQINESNKKVSKLLRVVVVSKIYQNCLFSEIMKKVSN